MTMDREIQGLYAAQNSNFGIIWATGLRRKQRLDFQSTIITALAKDEVTGAIVVGNSRSGMSDYDLGEPVGVWWVLQRCSHRGLTDPDKKLMLMLSSAPGLRIRNAVMARKARPTSMNWEGKGLSLLKMVFVM